MRDDAAMQRAIELAQRARRVVAPRPHVGCVLVRDGTIVGEGATGACAGGGHAETHALAAANGRARGATAVVTLEPCDHHGATPPCTEALVAAGVARVVVGCTDPDPRVDGRGIERLRRAGVAVDTGVEAGAVAEQLAAYLHHRRTGRAYAILKVASSLDGRSAAADGTSRWITGPAARADVHALRADSQAVLVGGGTARADDPALTVRTLPAGDDIPLGPAPLRVVLDARGRLPATGALFDTANAPTLVCTTASAAAGAVAAWKETGAEVVEVGAGAAGSGVDLDAVLQLLAQRGVLQVLVEGGAALHAAFLAEGRAQRLVVYVSNTLLGSGGLAALPVPAVATIADAPRFTLGAARRLGGDVRLDYDLTPTPAPTPAPAPPPPAGGQ